MKRLPALVGLLVVALMLPLSAGATKPQTITIESWLMRQPDATNPLVQGQVDACAKVWIGDEIADIGGDPLWTSGPDGSYTNTNADPSLKCGDWTPVGGYRFEGQGHLTNPLDHALFARHEITLDDGAIFIQFVGKYSPSFAGDGNWVITGGTGPYEGLQGTGNWTAQGHLTNTGLYFMHTETGTVHWTGR